MKRVARGVLVVLVTRVSGDVLVGGVWRMIRRADVVVTRLAVHRLHVICSVISMC